MAILFFLLPAHLANRTVQILLAKFCYGVRLVVYGRLLHYRARFSSDSATGHQREKEDCFVAILFFLLPAHLANRTVQNRVHEVLPMTRTNVFFKKPPHRRARFSSDSATGHQREKEDCFVAILFFLLPAHLVNRTVQIFACKILLWRAPCCLWTTAALSRTLQFRFCYGEGTAAAFTLRFNEIRLATGKERGYRRQSSAKTDPDGH